MRKFKLFLALLFINAFTFSYTQDFLESTSLGINLRMDHYFGAKISDATNPMKKVRLPDLNTGGLGLQYELDFNSIATRFSFDFGFPSNLDYSYQLYQKDHNGGYKQPGRIKFNTMDLLLEMKLYFYIMDIEGFYFNSGAGVRIVSKMYELDYDTDKYYVNFDNEFENYEANKRFRNARFLVRVGFGYEYEFEKIWLFAEGDVNVSDIDLYPEFMVETPYLFSLRFGTGVRYYL
jgi:hypothetical protein